MGFEWQLARSVNNVQSSYLKFAWEMAYFGLNDGITWVADL